MRCDRLDRLAQQVRCGTRRNTLLDGDRSDRHVDAVEQAAELRFRLARQALMTPESLHYAEQELLRRLHALEVDLHGRQSVTRVGAEYVDPDRLPHTSR